MYVIFWQKRTDLETQQIKLNKEIEDLKQEFNVLKQILSDHELRCPNIKKRYVSILKTGLQWLILCWYINISHNIYVCFKQLLLDVQNLFFFFFFFEPVYFALLNVYNERGSSVAQSTYIGCVLSLRIGLWNFPTIKLGKSRYHLYWVDSTISQ